MRALFAFVACCLAFATSCSSDPSDATTPTPTPTPTPADSAPVVGSNLTVSDAVPTIDELRELGLSERGAQCFIDIIDPDGTGTVQSADAFVEAWTTCL